MRAYSDAFLTGDATTAYELLSERCRKRTSLSEFTGIVTAAKQMYGSPLPWRHTPRKCPTTSPESPIHIRSKPSIKRPNPGPVKAVIGARAIADQRIKPPMLDSLMQPRSARVARRDRHAARGPLGPAPSRHYAGRTCEGC